MMWFLLVFILIIIIIVILLIKNRILGKKVSLIIGVVIVACGLFGVSVLYKLTNNSINSNWYIMAERSGIDGWSNKVYFYTDGKVIIDNSVNQYTSELDENIDLYEVYNYIKANGNTEYSTGYKIILNKNYKETRYISDRNEKIEKFLKVIDRGMSMK